MTRSARALTAIPARSGDTPGRGLVRLLPDGPEVPAHSHAGAAIPEGARLRVANPFGAWHAVAVDL